MEQTMTGMMVVSVLTGVTRLKHVAFAEAGAYWKFTSGSNIVDDVSGNGHMLTTSGAAFAGGTAVFSTLGTLDLKNNTNLTAEFFVRIMSTQIPLCVFEHSTNFNNNPGAFCMCLDGSAGRMTGPFKTGTDREQQYFDKVRPTTLSGYTNEFLQTPTADLPREVAYWPFEHDTEGET